MSAWWKLLQVLGNTIRHSQATRISLAGAGRVVTRLAVKVICTIIGTRMRHNIHKRQSRSVDYLLENNHALKSWFTYYTKGSIMRII